jgi:hypothetical protein
MTELDGARQAVPDGTTVTTEPVGQTAEGASRDGNRSTATPTSADGVSTTPAERRLGTNGTDTTVDVTVPQPDSDATVNETVGPWQVERSENRTEVESDRVEYVYARGDVAVELAVDGRRVDVSVRDGAVDVEGTRFEIEHYDRSLRVDAAGFDYRDRAGTVSLETGDWDLSRSPNYTDVEGPAVEYVNDRGRVSVDVVISGQEFAIEVDDGRVDVTGPGFEIEQRGETLRVRRWSDPRGG